MTTDWWVENGWMVAIACGLLLALLTNVIAYLYRRFLRARVKAALRDASDERPQSAPDVDR